MIPLETNDDLLKYIPQRPPFVMLSALYSSTERTVVSGLKIEEENILVENGVLRAGGLVENMAQTAALFAGLKAHASNKKVPVGFIASIKSLKISKLPHAGDTIYTSVEMVNEVMNMQIAMAHISDEEEKTIASCELRIFIKPEENQN